MPAQECQRLAALDPAAPRAGTGVGVSQFQTLLMNEGAMGSTSFGIDNSGRRQDNCRMFYLPCPKVELIHFLRKIVSLSLALVYMSASVYAQDYYWCREPQEPQLGSSWSFP